MYRFNNIYSLCSKKNLSSYYDITHLSITNLDILYI